MPLFYQQNINDTTKLAIWKIEESEDFFNLEVPLSRAITHPHKRLQHLAARYLLPYLFPGFPNEEIKIADTRKPYLLNEEYHFSISHCADYAAVIVSTSNRVGIDVELMTSKIEKIKHKFLHPAEARFVNSQSSSIQLQLLSIIWSAKEAMFKWYGLGEIDFSEMLRFFPFELNKQGKIDAAFIKQDLQHQLSIDYELFEDLILAYVIS